MSHLDVMSSWFITLIKAAYYWGEKFYVNGPVSTCPFLWNIYSDL